MIFDDRRWLCGKYQLSLARPRIMGILNVTPDSFSDGGSYVSADAAIERGLAMLDEGADIIDVGGESTRPGHTPVTPEEEAERVVPVVRGLVAAGAIVSIDTRHAEVARMCLRLGASIVNDVSGFTDADMVELVASSDCGCIVMHWDDLTGPSSRKEVTLDAEKPVRAVAQTRRFTLPDDGPIMRNVMGFLADQARCLLKAGVAAERIAIDPGAGFSKNANEDVVIQRSTKKLNSMGYPLVCAISRKRFVGAISGVTEVEERDAASAGVIISAVAGGARILRVHDVAEASQALNAYWAVAQKDERQAFISIGSNVGDRLNYLSKATKLIDELPLTCVHAVSHAYESEPAYGIATSVANAVVEIRTELHPLVLIDKLLDIENQLGRIRKAGEEGHGPRTIDCDLVWVEGEIHAGAKLTLPHPRFGERDYVLTPMEDLMHDPKRFFSHSGIELVEPELRVGKISADLGTLDWENA